MYDDLWDRWNGKEAGLTLILIYILELPVTNRSTYSDGAIDSAFDHHMARVEDPLFLRGNIRLVIIWEINDLAIVPDDAARVSHIGTVDLSLSD